MYKPTAFTTPAKTSKASTTAHTAKTSKGMGDYYGTGIKQKIGKMRSPTVGMTPVSAKKVKTPPRTLA